MDSYSRFIEPTVHTQKIGIARSKEQLFKRRKDQAIPPTTRSRGSPCLKFDEECKIWSELPEYLEEVTEDNCFVISHWQCCEKPAYQIQEIEVGGRLYVSGVGSWYGAYGGYLPINDHHLKRPYGKDKLYVYR